MSQPSEDTLYRSAQDLLGKAIVTLMLREPFFAHITGGLPRIFTEEIRTMAVGIRGDTVHLLVNPRFLVEDLKTAELRVGVLKHEILHVVLGHLFRRMPEADGFLWNIAADLVVNQLVAPFRLPKDAVTIETFEGIGLRSDGTVEQYYRQLIKARDAPHRFPRWSDAIQRLRSGGEPSDHSLWADSPSRNIAGEPLGAAIPGGLVEGLSRAFQDRVLMAHHRTAVSRGTVPGWIARLVGEIEKSRQPRVDWRRAMRIFAASTVRSRLVTTRRRESRRYESIPGLRRQDGLKFKRRQRMAVAVDTSGSVGASQLRAFFAEIAAIHRSGCEVWILECDVEVTNAWRYDGRSPAVVSGGGGTSFDGALQWLRDQKERRFDGCIYFTDGLAPAPQVRPPCPVLWVLCGKRTEEDHLPGRVIAID